MPILIAALLSTAPWVCAASVEITHLQHQISETQDRLLVAEDRVADEDIALAKDQKILRTLQGVAGLAASVRKLKEAQFIVDTHLKKRLEWEAIAAVERAQLAIWKLQLDRANGGTVADTAIEDSYRALWNQRAVYFARMKETWLLKHAYEKEHHESLEILARSGAISDRALMESDFRVKEAFHEAELSERRAESAGKFLR